MKTQPTAEQLAALASYAKSYGRQWKANLRQSWMTGNYLAGDNAPALQQIRNTFGPSWLVRFKLPTEQPKPQPKIVKHNDIAAHTTERVIRAIDQTQFNWCPTCRGWFQPIAKAPHLAAITAIKDALADAHYRCTGEPNGICEVFVGGGSVPVLMTQTYSDSDGIEVWQPLTQSIKTADTLEAIKRVTDHQERHTLNTNLPSNPILKAMDNLTTPRGFEQSAPVQDLDTTLTVLRDVAAMLPVAGRLHPDDLFKLQTRVTAAIAKAEQGGN